MSLYRTFKILNLLMVGFNLKTELETTKAAKFNERDGIPSHASLTIFGEAMEFLRGYLFRVVSGFSWFLLWNQGLAVS